MLPGEGRRRWFRESWLGTIASGATRLIARQGNRLHAGAVNQIIGTLRETIPIGNLGAWTKHEREALHNLAPVIGLIDDLDSWPAADKRMLVKMIRAKGAATETQYVKLMSRHKRLYSSLREFCRKHQDF